VGWFPTLGSSLSSEFGADGVTANVIGPGHVAEAECFGHEMTDERHRGKVVESGRQSGVRCSCGLRPRIAYRLVPYGPDPAGERRRGYRPLTAAATHGQWLGVRRQSGVGSKPASVAFTDPELNLGARWSR